MLVTPARDEERVIGATLAAVAAQSRPPRRWVVVDDGSGDATAAVVAAHLDSLPYLRLVRRPRGPRGFGSKVAAFAAGYAAAADAEHDFVGNLDADVTVAPDYFERVLAAFAAAPRLGLAGGAVVERRGGRLVPQRVSANSVAGAVQLFRRQCFEDVGGFVALELGGEDAAAEILARATGWEVRTLFDLPVLHHGPVLGGSRGAVRARFRRGVANHALGYDPVFQVAVSAYRTTERPYVAGGAAMLAGYAWAAARRRPRPVPARLVSYLRSEQRRRLAGHLRGRGVAVARHVPDPAPARPQEV